METISNLRLLVRLLVASAAFAIIGFSCGYLGPLYLLRDAGVGPVTGFFMAPLGVLIGAVAAVWGSVKGYKPPEYAARLGMVAAVFAAAIVALVLVQ